MSGGKIRPAFRSPLPQGTPPYRSPEATLWFPERVGRKGSRGFRLVKKDRQSLLSPRQDCLVFPLSRFSGFVKLYLDDQTPVMEDGGIRRGPGLAHLLHLIRGECS